MSADKAEKLQQIRNTEKIFLIEVVIQKVLLDVIELSDLAFRNAETCLSYRFLEHGPFKICEKDFKSKSEDGGCAGCNQLKNGNSTMFAIFPEEMIKLKANGFQIDVEVLKMFKPVPKVVGTTEVQMKDIFNAVLEHMAKKFVESVSKSMKNRYKLRDSEGDPVGYADLFVRLSSMGKMIVTKFQMDMAKECMEFQTNAGNTYKYKKQVFPDPYLCKPCGKPTQMFPPYEKVAELPKDFPTFKITNEIKERLQSRRNKELGIEEEPVVRKSGGKSKGGKGKKEEVITKPAEPKAIEEPPVEEAPAAAEEPPAEEEAAQEEA